MSEKRAEPEHGSSAPASVVAAARLRDLIARGQLAPGHQLREVALAAELDVSRNTLREAFTALAAEGLVERVRNRGVFVAVPKADDVRRIFAARRLMEPAALAWGEFDAAQLAALRVHAERAELAQRWGDLDGLAAQNQAFQTVLMLAGGSEILNGLMGRIQAAMRLLFDSMAAVPAFHALYVEGHQTVAGLLEGGDRFAAAEAWRVVLENAEAELLKHLAAQP